ncbi:MAG: tail fiber domain-containing protein [Bacteroidota bacterium]
MKELRIFLLVMSCLLSLGKLLAQNTGIGTISPSHTLHVKTVSGNPNSDPLRIEGLLNYIPAGDTAVLLVNPDSGIVRIMHMDSLMAKHGLNIYNTDGTLSEHIVVSMNNKSLMFASTDTIYFSPDGNLGIGTTAPASLMTVVRTRLPFIPSLTDDTQATFENNGVAGISIIGANTARSQILFSDQNSLNPGSLVYQHNSNQLEFQTNGSINMMLDSSGYLGIGTLDPQAPLHISRSSSLDPENYINGGDNDNVYSSYRDEYSTLATGSTAYSVIAEERIAANEFNAYSDVRIKQDVEHSNALEDLALIQKLEVKDYSYIDPLKNGSGSKKGFVAQEVKEIFPQATGKRKGVIPNLFQIPTQAKWQEGKLKIKLALPHHLVEGNKVRIISEDGEKLYTVSQLIDTQTFVVHSPEVDTNKLFIYGSEVEDFHTLDYDEIFTLNVSATQALAKKVEQMEEQLARQGTMIQELMKLNSQKKKRRKNGKKK